MVGAGEILRFGHAAEGGTGLAEVVGARETILVVLHDESSARAPGRPHPIGMPSGRKGASVEGVRKPASMLPTMAARTNCWVNSLTMPSCASRSMWCESSTTEGEPRSAAGMNLNEYRAMLAGI